MKDIRKSIYNGVDLNDDRIRRMVFTEFHFCPCCDDGEDVIMVNDRCLRCGFPYKTFKEEDVTEEEKDIFWKLNKGYKDNY
jgi:hypothetical protein